MKTSLAVVLLLAAGSPAWAWTNTNKGPGPKQIVDGGPGAQATATARGGLGGAGGTGGSGGSAISTGGNASATGNSVSVVNGGSSGGGGDSRRAPDIALPSVGGGGMDCPTVGFGAAGSGLGGGGGIGPSWISSRCDHRKYAMDVIQPLLGRKAAIAYLQSVEPDVDDFVKAWQARAPAAQPQPVVPPVPSWCLTASPRERYAHKEECRVTM